MLAPEQTQYNHEQGLPHNFSWLLPKRIAGTSTPRRWEQLQALVAEGVSHLVSLSPEVAPPNLVIRGLTIHFIGVKESKAPSLEQFQDFINICEEARRKKEGVAVHCAGGNGRTGSMLAVYLVWSRGVEARAAVKEVRRTRPGSIEFKEQMEAVLSYQATSLMKIQHFQKQEI